MERNTNSIHQNSNDEYSVPVPDASVDNDIHLYHLHIYHDDLMKNTLLNQLLSAGILKNYLIIFKLLMSF